MKTTRGGYLATLALKPDYLRTPERPTCGRRSKALDAEVYGGTGYLLNSYYIVPPAGPTECEKLLCEYGLTESSAIALLRSGGKLPKEVRRWIAYKRETKFVNETLLRELGMSMAYWEVEP